ncbi:MAG: hypothetical protein RO009_23235 [Pseudorhodoplanes sp.]|jgi:hypothetical protein|nr:hypothetical protein [Pseudorhodoplanes sp.]
MYAYAYNRVRETDELLERLKRAIYAAAGGAEIIAAVVVATDEMRKAWGVKIDEDPKPWSEALTLLENLYTVDDVHILAQCVCWTETHVLVPIPQQ